MQHNAYRITDTGLLVLLNPRFNFRIFEHLSIPSYLKYYHVIGNEKMEKDFLIDEEERIIWVKAKDDYNSLPSKVIAAFSAIQQTHTFKYIFKSDDSVLLQNDGTQGPLWG